MNTDLLRCLLLLSAGWASREQRDVIDYLREENRALREQLGAKRPLFANEQRRRLARSSMPTAPRPSVGCWFVDSGEAVGKRT